MFAIAVSNHKGGVAKTTTAISVAASLAQQGQRVVAFDLDPQNNLSMGLGLRPSLEGPSAFELIRGKAEPREVLQPAPHPSLELLQVVPGGLRLAQAEGWFFGKMGYDEVLRERLAGLSRGCDYVVLDCPPSLGALTLNAICAAQLVLAPVQCEHFSARGLESLLEVVRLYRERRNPELGFLAVPTLYDKRNRISRDVLEEIHATYGPEVSEVVVGVDTRVRESQARGLPVGIHAPRSRASLAYDALALELQRMALGRQRAAA